MSDPAPSPTRQLTLATLRRDVVLTSCIVAATFALVMSIAVFVPLAAQLERATLDGEEIVGLAEYVLFLHGAFWPVIALSLISCVVSALMLYRRMRSPMVRFVRVFNAIGEGHHIPAPIRIRATDYLSQEAEALNRMLTQLARRAAERQALVERLIELHGDLAEAGVDPALLEELQSIAKHPLNSLGAEGRGETR